MPLTAMITKLSSFTPCSDAEISYLKTLNPRLLDVDRHVTLVNQGVQQEKAFVLTSGWSCCYKLLENGRRQIVDFLVPGDFMGIRPLLLLTPDHSVSTISPCRICEFSWKQIREIYEEQPRIALAFLWAMARDEAIIVEHLVNLGRRTALQRTAHLMTELLYRLQLVGLGKDDTFECALTQDDLADALGLSNVHINRVLRTLRERNILTFQDRRVVIHDRIRLADLAGFDPGYLDQPQGELP